jgi:hypothetical protein
LDVSVFVVEKPMVFTVPSGGVYNYERRLLHFVVLYMEFSKIKQIEIRGAMKKIWEFGGV